MSPLVLDASVLVAATSDPGPEGRWAERVVEARSLLAPHHVLVEATNILRRLEAATILAARDAEAARQDLLRLDLTLYPFEPFADRIWELRSNLTSYDAWYVALAEALEVPMATLDRRLARVPGTRCEFRVPGEGPA